MANQKISDLASAGALGGTELMEVVQGGVNKQTTAQTVANLKDVSAYTLLTNSAVALTDGAAIDLTATKHTLTSTQATITFTISYTGDDIVIELTLNATSSTWTFPATALCVSEGVASGDNTLGLSGVSGDKYIITIKNMESNYYVVAKNFGQ